MQDADRVGEGPENTSNNLDAQDISDEALSHSEAEQPQHLSDLDDTDDDDDPVIAEYDVFLNNSVHGSLHLFQYVNRDASQPYSTATRSNPLDVRFKPRAGMVEVDVPMNIKANYDREKGIVWGEAMRKSRQEKGGDAFGLAGGFGMGSTGGGRAGAAGLGGKNGGRNNGAEEIPQDVLLANFEDAINKGRVLDKQTLGGITNPKDTIQPQYFIGVFRNDQVHLNPLKSITQLRPQFHHLDAVADQEKSSIRAQHAAAHPPRLQEARAVQMTVKSADGDDLESTEVGKTLRAAQEEEWIRHKYFDENTDESWSIYDRLFIPDGVFIPELKSELEKRQWLDKISAPRYDPSSSGKIKKLEPEVIISQIEVPGETPAPTTGSMGPPPVARKRAKGKQKA